MYLISRKTFFSQAVMWCSSKINSLAYPYSSTTHLPCLNLHSRLMIRSYHTHYPLSPLLHPCHLCLLHHLQNLKPLCYPVTPEVQKDTTTNSYATLPPSSPPTSPLSPGATTTTTELLTEPTSPGLPELLGRGHRQRQQSVLLKNYIINYARNNTHTPALPDSTHGSSTTVSGNSLYPIENYLSDAKFSSSHKVLLQQSPPRLNQKRTLKL